MTRATLADLLAAAAAAADTGATATATMEATTWIAIGILGIVLGLLFLVNWIPVLVNGRQASSIVNFTGGFYRWTFRVLAYGLLLTGTYPPFRLGE